MNWQFSLKKMFGFVLVLVIVGVLGFEFLKSLGFSKREHTLTALTVVERAVHSFANDTGSLPPELVDLEEYCVDQMFLRDGWGRPIIFEVSAESRTLRIGSYGKDGEVGGTAESEDIIRTFRCYDDDGTFYVGEKRWLQESRIHELEHF